MFWFFGNPIFFLDYPVINFPNSLFPSEKGFNHDFLGMHDNDKVEGIFLCTSSVIYSCSKWRSLYFQPHVIFLPQIDSRIEMELNVRINHRNRQSKF